MKGYENCPKTIRGKDPGKKEEYDDLFREEQRTGDKNLRSQLMSYSIPYVISTADRYRQLGDFDDLVEEGMRGLIKAYNHYNPDKGIPFNSYAVWHIQMAIMRSRGSHNRLIKLPYAQIKNLRSLAKETESFYKNHGRNPSIEELAGFMYSTPEEIKKLQNHAEPVSLDSTYEDGDGGDSLEARTGDSKSGRESDIIDAKDFIKKTLHKASLDSTEETLLYQRYALRMKLRELGEEYGVSHQTISQRLIVIEKKMRMVSKEGK